MRLLKLVLILCLFCIGVPLHAQDLPVIESFTVDKALLNYSATEAGRETAVFSWRVTGLRAGDHMEMHALVADQWALIGRDFDPAKTDTLVIAHPRNFGLPTYRLSVVDSAGNRVAEQQLVLDYEAPTSEPIVNFFLPRIGHITPDELKAGTIVPVHWQIGYRWRNSNPVFEQVMPDGSTFSIELPRTDPWVRAWSEGAVLPKYPGDGEDVVLRIRVVNVDDGSTLAQKDTILPVIDPETPPIEVLDFSVSPNPAQLGGTATISWDVANARRVYITQTVTGKSGCKFTLPPDEVYQDLPASGSIDITIPEDAVGPIRLQLVPDRYVVPAFSCEPSDVAREIKLELDRYTYPYDNNLNYVSLTPGLVTVAGDTLTLNWSVNNGQSVLVKFGLGYSSTVLQIFTDLPLTGTLNITVPDTVDVRLEGRVWAYLYVVTAENSTPESYLWATSVGVDRDDSLTCESYIDTSPSSYKAKPGETVTLTWDTCGSDSAVLRSEFENYDDYTVLWEATQTAAASGTQPITLPDEKGFLRLTLIRVMDGQEIELQRTSIQVTTD